MNNKGSLKQLRFVEKLKPKTWISTVLSCLGALLYLIQSVYYAHHLDVTMDEGTYLVKGLLFVTGVYRPFQPYGPWTNKMPLAFTIPGLAQAVFEPGLRTGRYFAVFLSMLMLLGMWLVTRRLRGNWWAALVVWVLALNTGNITYYSRAISQGLVACMFVWVFVFALGKDRKLWQTTLSAALASLLVMTRQNMLPVPFFLVLYIFWEHGKRAGLYALLSSAAIFIGFHALYWPDIFQIWRPYLPKAIKNLIPITTAASQGAKQASSFEYNLLSRFFVFWEGFRLNFFALTGMIASWIFWPRKRDWKQESDFKAAVFISVTLMILIALHFWASILKSYCLYCYPGYLSFFMPVAILLFVIAIPSWSVKFRGGLRQLLAIVVVLIGATGIAWGSYQVLDDLILNIQVPRMKNMRILPGTTEIWRFLFNKFGWSYEMLQQFLPTLAGFAVALLIILLGVVICVRKRTSWKPGFVALLLFVVMGTILSPLKILGGGKYADVCSEDIINAHEEVGAYLASEIPEGSLVFWKNDVTPLPLLYLPDREIFPPQLNHWYSYFYGGDSDALFRKGYWNEELSDQWIEEADFLLVADRYMNWFNNKNIDLEFDELSPTGETVPSRDNSFIHIFKRIK